MSAPVMARLDIGPESLPAAVQRLEAMVGNLVGAVGREMRRDRAALRTVLSALTLRDSGEPRDMATAPRDDTTIWLLVDYSPDEAAHPLVDASLAWTLGMNSFDNTGEDAWRFVGWCWSHDHFTEGRGKPVAWKPVGFELEAEPS